LPDAVNPVTAYSVANCHAADMLIIGVQNLVFMSDILNPGGGTPICPVAETLRGIDAQGFAPETVVGGHGATVATADDVHFKIDYLKKLKELRAANTTPEALATALRKAYPNLPGADGVEALAKAMYPHIQ
ncbi:MAG: hypothetical protein OWT27_09725, partial [Firmicutes bacterium]|nr:hypothetical protein [Bacillota bacterium]